MLFINLCKHYTQKILHLSLLVGSLGSSEMKSKVSESQSIMNEELNTTSTNFFNILNDPKLINYLTNNSDDNFCYSNEPDLKNEHTIDSNLINIINILENKTDILTTVNTKLENELKENLNKLNKIKIDYERVLVKY